MVVHLSDEAEDGSGGTEIRGGWTGGWEEAVSAEIN
jgi:hypothetical protein